MVRSDEEETGFGDVDEHLLVPCMLVLVVLETLIFGL